MNSRFDKYLKLIRQEGSSEESIEQAKAELHKTFAALTQEEQKYANIFLHDIERGDVIAEDGKRFVTTSRSISLEQKMTKFTVLRLSSVLMRINSGI